MRKIQVDNKKILLRLIIGLIVGIAVSFLTVLLCAFAITKTEQAPDNCFPLLLSASSIGSFFACIIAATSVKSKRLLYSVIQGTVTSLLFFLSVIAFNRFEITGFAWLIPLSGLTIGAITGTILVFFR